MLIAHDPDVAEETIISYNVIEHLLKNRKEMQLDAITKAMGTAFSVDYRKAETLVKLMQHEDAEVSEWVVKVSWQRTSIPAGQTKAVKCTVRTGFMSTNQEVELVPDDSPRWPDGLSINKTIIYLPNGT